MKKRKAKSPRRPGKQADELLSAAGRFLDRMVEYASAVAEELRRSASPSIRPDRQLLRTNCQALERQLLTVGVSTDGKALTDGKVLNLGALTGYGFSTIALMSCFATSHRSRGRPAMNSLADLATKTLNTVVKKKSRPAKELVDGWESAVAELAAVARSLKAEGEGDGKGHGAASPPKATDILARWIREVFQDRPAAENREYLNSEAIFATVKKKHPNYDRKLGTFKHRLTALANSGVLQSKTNAGYRLLPE